MNAYKHLTYSKPDAEEMYARAHSPATGAIVIFSGEARDNIHDSEKKVTGLYYEAFEEAAEISINSILTEAIQIFKLNKAECIHRLGPVPLAESAILLLTAHARRIQAFEAAMYIMDRIKAETPIWKKETFADGSSHWGMNPEALKK